MRGQRIAALAVCARIAGVGNEQGYMVLLVVSGGALAVRAVGTAELAMIRGHHDDGVVSKTQCLQLIEDPFNHLVGLADAIEVIVQQSMPAWVLVGIIADQCTAGQLIFFVGRRPPLLVKRLVAAPGQPNVPLLLVERRTRLARDGYQRLRVALDVLAGGVGVVEHHVVGIDEVDRLKPGLALLAHGLTTNPQPAPGLGPDHIVVEIAALGLADDVADAD